MKQMMIETMLRTSNFGKVSYIGDYMPDLQKMLLKRYCIDPSIILSVSEKTILGIRYCEIIYRSHYDIKLERQGLHSEEIETELLRVCSNLVEI